MAKRHKARRRYFGRKRRDSSKMKNIPLAPTLGLGVALTAPAVYAWNQGGTASQKIINYARGLSVNATAYDPVANKWFTGGLQNFYGPIAVGVIAHKLAGYSGLNRILAKSKVGITI